MGKILQCSLGKNRKSSTFLCSGSDETNFEAFFEGIGFSHFFVLLHKCYCGLAQPTSEE